MSDEMLIRHCAPTLAGIKTGSLFSCKSTSREETLSDIRELNRRLVPRGLRILPLKCTGDRVLVYVYRPTELSTDLQRSEVRKILEKAGYRTSKGDECVMELMRRVNEVEEFPHEIGLFLSYPPEDVSGFIQNRGANSKFVGCWTVYGDVDKAQETFKRYKFCTRRYCDIWAKGAKVENLTVSVS